MARYPEEHVADERTLRRWFAARGLASPPPPAARAAARAAVPHRIWQLDAKEQVPLASGERASWLLATDEASGAALDPVIFPPLLRPYAFDDYLP